MIVIEAENIEENLKLKKRKEKIGREALKKKFKFKKRGKLTKAEQK